jgi:hypothetical protein
LCLRPFYVFDKARPHRQKVFERRQKENTFLSGSLRIFGTDFAKFVQRTLIVSDLTARPTNGSTTWKEITKLPCCVGVPVIAPVPLSRLNPGGRDPETIDQL